MTRTSGINQRIADRLLNEGRISGDQHRLAIAHASRHRVRIEDALVELDILKEGDLLKYIATVYGTRFVSTEKLSKAVIDPRVLAKVAKRTADLYGVFPVLHDDASNVLSIVTADPDNDAAMHEIKLAARVREVRALVARPAAVRAAIQQYYYGDMQAFAALLRPALPLDYYQTGFERQLPVDPITPAPGQRGAYAQPPQAPQQPVYAQQPGMPMQQPQQGYPGAAMGTMQQQPGMPMQPGQQFPQQMPFGQQGPQPQVQFVPQQGYANGPMGQPMGFPGGMGGPTGTMPQGPMQPQQMPQGMQPQQMPQGMQPQQMPQGMQPQQMQPQAMPSQMPQQMQPPPTPHPPPPQAVQPVTVASATEAARSLPGRGSVMPESTQERPHATSPSVVVAPTSTHEFTETLNVLVSLLENARAELRGHSATVARLMKKTCERIGLPGSSVASFVLAAYLHDLGKMGTYHLTPFNVAEYEGHRIAALKVVDLPGQLLASVGLPHETLAAIGAMYERYDGQGFPNGQAGKEIPLGARILAVADTYADLTQNPRNPFRKILRPVEACEALDQFRGKIFDPNIVDLFRQAMTGDDMRARLLADRHQVLIVDPDPEETTVLELRLIEQGFEVRIARNTAQAKHELKEREVTAVVSEIDLEEPGSGLELRTEALRESWGKEAVWVILTAKTDRQSAQSAFDLKVDDFVSKPASGDILAAKLRQLIERRAAKEGGRGVSGSLAEMGLPDMVQILWHGRKTCALKINAKGMAGEIDFAEGQIVHATWGSVKGEDAFYKMLTLREGDFRLDPTYVPSIRSIQASPEGLLLEGMRRQDEGTVIPD